ncbi:MAG: prefoldin subunit alpha [Candidatus Methanoperedens sp.]|nr:prefoldin subunit alpha [Candidatus Methanoperedens sp.]
MSDEKLTQQQLQELAARHQQYQYQAESIAQQINMLKLTLKDLETALTTITALKDIPAGNEVLVPVGFGSFVNATLSTPDKVVIGIGAGVSVEKKTDDAKAILEKRKDELNKYYEQLNSAFTKLATELQGIEGILQKYTAQTQQPMSAE